MALRPQTIPINFAGGLDLKTDPQQIRPGKFLRLTNSVFSEGEALKKRVGFPALSSLPVEAPGLVTTFKDNLEVFADKNYTYSSSLGTWNEKGNFQSVALSALSVYRSSSNQTQVDSAISSNDIICTVFTDVGNATVYRYVLSAKDTGQILSGPVALADVASPPKVFTLGSYFLILFLTSGNQFKFIAVNATTFIAASSALIHANGGSFDGIVNANQLFLAWSTGSTVRLGYINTNLSVNSIELGPYTGSIFSLACDSSAVTPVIYVSFFDGTSLLYVLAMNSSLALILNPISFTPLPSVLVGNLTSQCLSGSVQLIYEIENAYGYDGSVPTNYINTVNVSQAGTVGSQIIIIRSLGLASKAFTVISEGATPSNNGIYFTAEYSSQFQPTYFIVDMLGNIVARFAYSNAVGGARVASAYFPNGIPSVSVSGSIARIPYLIKDLIEPVNKDLNPLVPGGLYSQTGINMLTVEFGALPSVTEAAGNLNISSGFLWSYDGLTLAEQNFHVWPDSVQPLSVSTGGAMSAQQYYYVIVYEWTDNQGNVFRSAPSVPQYTTPTAGSGISFTATFLSGALTILATSSTAGLRVGQVLTDQTTPGNITAGTYIKAIVGPIITISQPTAGVSGAPDTIKTVTTCSATINVPRVRLTYKNTPIRIVPYRWSTAQQTFYQLPDSAVPENTGPFVVTLDYVTIVDTFADSSIIGNNILYTTGGVVENTCAPAFTTTAIFKDRLFGISAEDENLLLYSKEIEEATPVEMTTEFSLFSSSSTPGLVPPSGMGAIVQLDDKFVILRKKNGVSYFYGTGPEITGANNDYTPPIFVPSAVGCTNPKSLVVIPEGVMFQASEGQGIWLLGRDLVARYIGADVEQFNSATVVSGLLIPGTTEVRFMLDNGVTLLYDYFYQQWGSFSNPVGVSATIYNGAQTYVDANGKVYKETPGTYTDGINPVLISFTTGWFNLAGLQGFERAYEFYLLGTYLSPHKLMVSIAYDYNPNPTQVSIITPDNYTPNFGGDSLYGGSEYYAGPGSREQWRVFFQKQKCEAFQITVQEIYDPSFGVPPGAGLTLSGIDLVVGLKDGKPRLKASRSVG